MGLTPAAPGLNKSRAQGRSFSSIWGKAEFRVSALLCSPLPVPEAGPAECTEPPGEDGMAN